MGGRDPASIWPGIVVVGEVHSLCIRFWREQEMIQPMNSSQVAALLKKTAKAAEAGQFELYKTSRRFDGTYANPQWLG
jgi:hypothetical protein